MGGEYRASSLLIPFNDSCRINLQEKTQVPSSSPLPTSTMSISEFSILINRFPMIRPIPKLFHDSNGASQAPQSALPPSTRMAN